MRAYVPAKPESLPKPTAPDFQYRLIDILEGLDHWAQDAAFGFNRIIQGQTPDGSGNPIPIPDTSNFFYLPGRLNQVANWADTAGPILTFNTGRDSTTPIATSIFKFLTADASPFTLFSVRDDGATTIATPYYTSGNPVLLSLEMRHNTTLPSQIFKIITGAGANEVFTVSYTGTTSITMSANSTAFAVTQVGGSTSDFAQFLGGGVRLGIDVNGDLYGGTAGSSTLLLLSNNLAGTSSARISLASTSTDVTFDIVGAGGYVPFRFGLGLASGSMSGISTAINITSTGGNPGTMSVSNVGGTNASVLYKAIRIATQTGNMFSFFDSDGTTLLSAINSAGAYRLVAGAAVGSVLTSDVNGVGSWSTIAALTASFADNLFSLFDNVTPTKIAQFQLASLTAGTNTFTLPNTAAGTFAMVNLVETFTRAQTIAPNISEMTLDLVEGNDGFSVPGVPMLRATDAGANVLLAVATLTDPGALTFSALHVAPEIDIWPTSVGSGIARSRISTLATTTVTFNLPAVSGTALVVAGSIIRTNSATTGTSPLVSINPTGGEYQINLALANGSTAGDRVLKVDLGWTDERGARTFPLIGSYALASTGAAQLPSNSIYTIRTSVGTTITVTATFTSGTTGTYNMTAGATKVV